MYKNCAQPADNQLENPVQAFPPFPPFSTIRRITQQVSRTFALSTHIVHSLKSHVLHSDLAQNNGGREGLIPHFHTAYYYYY